MKARKPIDSKTLEEALLDLLKHIYPDEPERLTVLAQRLGWTGDGIKTLQECGDMLGVTRERLRQIESEILQNIPGKEIYLPQIDKAIGILEKATPIPLENAAELLRDKGISGKPFNINGLQKTCITLGKEFNLQIGSTKYGEFLEKTEEAGQANRIIVAAGRLTRTSGATRPEQVAELLREQGLDVSGQYINRTLRSVDAFTFIDESWFRYSNTDDHMNRMFRVAKKLLCLVSPQALKQIRGGMIHVLKSTSPSAQQGSVKFAVVPPDYVLREMFSASEKFIVEDDMVKHKTPLSATVELNTAERIFVEIFRSAPNAVLEKRSLYRASLEKGIKMHSFYPLLSQTPIIEELETGLCKIRGDKIDAGLLVS